MSGSQPIIYPVLLSIGMQKAFDASLCTVATVLDGRLVKFTFRPRFARFGRAGHGGKALKKKARIAPDLFLAIEGRVSCYAAFLVSMPSTRLTAVGSSV